MAHTELITTQTVGGNQDFGPFAIEYLNITDIKVSLNGVVQTLTTHYTIDEPTSVVTFVTAPDVDDVIRIYRETSIDSPEAVYAPGSAIRAQNLNDNTDQALFALQELKEQYVTRSEGQFDTDVDLQTHKLTNVGDPTDPQDAVTKQYLEDNYFDDGTETILSTEAWVADDAHIATTQALDDRFFNKGDETITSGESWVDDDDHIATNQAITNITNLRHDTFVQTAEPTTAIVGKTWLQNDLDLTLRIWDGSDWLEVTSGGDFQELPNVIYVDAQNGEDTFDGGLNNPGHRISRPKQTIRGAIQQINDEEAHGSIVVVLPGVYAETLPIDIEADNIAIVGESLRNCIVHPLVPADHDYDADGPHANELTSMFRVNSGTFVANLTLMGMKADGAFEVNTLDPHPTHGLPENQGWNFSFFPGAFIAKSPYIQNCTNFSDSAIDNRTGFFDPHAKTVVTDAGPPVVTGPAPGFAQDAVSGPTGGGILVDGSVPDGDSPLRSMVCDSYTHVGLNGPGILVANNGYCQATSSYAFFNRYHLKCLNGGQANLAASTTDFGDFSLIAEGRSPEPVFTGEVVGQIAAGGPVTTTFDVDTFTAATDLYDNPADPKAWFGSATRPQDNMVVELEGTWYEVLSSSTTDGGTTWNVEILRFSTAPGDSRADNLGLDLTSTIPDNAVASFYLRSQVASSGHTMEYVGSGTDYSALPENGGQVVDANQITEVEANVGELPGKVYTAITDQNGNFKVGPLEVNQRNNTITIEAGAGTLFAVSGDINPQLGGNLDANGFDIIADTGSAVAPSITFTGETTSGLFNGGANSVNITTNGVERAEFGPTEVVFNDGGEDYDFRVEGDTEANLFFVDASTDRIGVGTNTPDSNLEIVNATASADNSLLKLHSSASTSSANLILEVNDGNTAQAALKLDNANKLHLQTFGGGALNNRLSIDGDGNVGIGTTTVNSLLEVRGSSDGQNVLHLSNSAGSSNGDAENQIRVTCNGNANWANLDIQAYQTIFTQDAGEKARIDDSGRLLVGTSTPLDAFSTAFIRGSSGGTGVVIARASTPANGQSLGTLYFSDQDGNYGAWIDTARDGGSWTGGSSHPTRLVFSTTADGDSSPTEAMRINSAGNISMGTANNIAKIDIRMTGAPVNNAIYAGRTSISSAGQGVYSYMTANAGLVSSSYSIYGQYVANTNSPGGGVIGVLSSVYAILGYYDTANSWGVYANGSMYCSGTYQGSDSRLKDIVEPISGGILDKLANLQPVKYRWKENTDQRESVGDGIQIGLIAQEVEEHFPELVKEITHNCPINHENLEDGQFDSSCSLNHELGTTKTLEYQHLTAVLVEALKEAKTRIETLEAKVTALENP